VASGAGFTVMAWVKTTESYGPIISFRSSTDDGSVIDLVVGHDGGATAAGQLMGLVRQDGGGTGYAHVTGAAVNDGFWHAVALSRNTSGQIELYLDGVSQGTNSGTQSSGAITSNERAVGSERRWVALSFMTADQRYLNGCVD